ncbi:MAG: gfo/Idh/MocA family oxidoreductase, partial [Planctomycetes bacterium]|nr:gfo/Idh/MocA family oxidoreductase [Planctomycetota bacterium]
MMTTQKKTKLGILGVAKINNRVIPSFAGTQFTELAAIASRSQEKANAAAKEANIPKAYGSYESLLKDPEIDIIYNPLPNHLHAEWTKKAADHGKHVICEKPLAPTAKEAEDIVHYCAKKGVKL